MKLWKRTVALMLITLLCSLIPVGVLSLYVTGKRSLNNAAETYGRQLANGKNLLEQFWDNSKYEQMSRYWKERYQVLFTNQVAVRSTTDALTVWTSVKKKILFFVTMELTDT